METSQPGSERMATRFPRGQRRMATLLVGLTALLLAAAGGSRHGGPAPAAAQALNPCLITLCITNLWVIPHGTYVEIVPITNKPASFYVEVSLNGSVVSSGFSFCCSTGWAGKVFNLEPYRPYTYMLRATAQNGQQATRTGTFVTLKRYVSVTFERINMIDDSDGGPGNDCDCLFWFQAGTYPPQHYGNMNNGVASGANVWPYVSYTAAASWSDSIRLRAQAIDRDCLQLECSDPTPGPFWDGSPPTSSYGDTATVEVWVSLLPLGAGNETFTKTFQKTSPSNKAPRFTVFGSYSVWYEP